MPHTDGTETQKYNRRQWQRSQQHFKDALDFIATGQLGNIPIVKCGVTWAGKPLSFVPDSPPRRGGLYSPAWGRARTGSLTTVSPFMALVWDHAGGPMDWPGCAFAWLCFNGNEQRKPFLQTILRHYGNFADPFRFRQLRSADMMSVHTSLINSGTCCVDVMPFGIETACSRPRTWYSALSAITALL